MDLLDSMLYQFGMLNFPLSLVCNYVGNYMYWPILKRLLPKNRPIRKLTYLQLRVSLIVILKQLSNVTHCDNLKIFVFLIVRFLKKSFWTLLKIIKWFLVYCWITIRATSICGLRTIIWLWWVWLWRIRLRTRITRISWYIRLWWWIWIIT